MSVTTRLPERGVARESGTLWIGDPCYLARRLHNREEWKALDSGWSTCEGAIVGEPLGPGLGVLVSGFDSNGIFNVLVKRDRAGRLLALRIAFADDLEADDLWFNEEEDDE